MSVLASSRPRVLASSRPRVLAWVAVCLSQTTPAQAGITSVSCSPQLTNYMRFDCTVELDHVGTVSMGHRIADGGAITWRTVNSTVPATVHVLTAYNFHPGFPYEVHIEDNLGAAVEALLGTPLLPSGLNDLQFVATGTPKSNYVLFDTDGCDEKRYLVVWNTNGGHIAWYQDIEAETSGDDLVGFSYEPAPGTPPTGTILGIVDERHVYEWTWSGSKANYYGPDGGAFDPWPACGALGLNGPCPHHDVTKDSAGALWAVTARIEPEVPIAGTAWAAFPACTVGTGGGFLNDGVLKAAGLVVAEDDSLMGQFGFDPAVEPGPSVHPGQCGTDQYLDAFGREDLIDWTHVNALSVVTGFEDTLLVSVPEHRQIIRYIANLDQVVWTMSGQPLEGDFTVQTHPLVDFYNGGPDLFAGSYADDVSHEKWDFQHDVHTESGQTIQFFDNHEDFEGPSRVLRVMPTMTGDALIVASWDLPDTKDAMGEWKYQCPSRGSGRTVPGTTPPDPLVNGFGTVMALCAKQNEIMELTNSTGGQDPPGYSLRLQGDACAGDPDGDGQPEHINSGWHRAYPLLGMGQQ